MRICNGWLCLGKSDDSKMNRPRMISWTFWTSD